MVCLLRLLPPQQKTQAGPSSACPRRYPCFLGCVSLRDCVCCVFCPCRLDLLAQTLTWRHLAPTAPDTLTCYPFADDDPFVMQQCPHVMFAGNQPQYETRMMEGGWRTVCVGWGCG